MPTPRLPSPDYPVLSGEIYWPWGPIRANFRLDSTTPSTESISQVRIIPFVGTQAVIIRIEDFSGHWDLPGGTLEPGENYLEAVERELLEEAGAQLVDFTPFGVLECVSERVLPYRSHLPHPNFNQVVGFAEVKLVGTPTNPGDGETISEVLLTDLEIACRKLSERPDSHWQEELCRVAAEIRGSS